MTNKKTLLIVEDEPALREAIRDKFIREGFAVIEARDGQEGLDESRSKHPDIVIMDLVMPVLDGLSVAEKLRQEPARANVPIVILTNLSENEQVDKALSLGINDFLVKSDTSLEKLVKIVKQKLNLA
jgi:DNA-binding response OmpR family regulator